MTLNRPVQRSHTRRGFFLDVTDTENREPPSARLVEQFQELGFVVLGRLLEEDGLYSRDYLFPRSEHSRLAGWRKRSALTLLARSDGRAYASADLYGDAPVALIRTELTDGSLVETVGISTWGRLQPRRGVDSLLRFVLPSAKGRSIRILHTATPRAVFDAHDDHVSQTMVRTGSPPRRHAERADALRLWNQAAAHAYVSARRWRLIQIAVTLAALIPAAVLNLLLAFYLVFQFDVRSGPAALGIVLATALPIYLAAGMRSRALQRRALERAIWRPPYERRM